MSESLALDISWTSILEKFFAQSAEKAEGLAWMHRESELIFTKYRTMIDLPVIVGSGIIAFLNAGSTSLFPSDPQMASVALGIGSLLVGIVNTLGSYFSFAKRAEGHRIAALSYAKLNRFLSIELGLPRDERMRPGDLLKMVKNDMDRLAETAPQIIPAVSTKFKARFKTTPVAKPSEGNGLHPVSIYSEEPMKTPGFSLEVDGPPLTVGPPTLQIRSAQARSASSPPPSSSA